MLKSRLQKIGWINTHQTKRKY